MSTAAASRRDFLKLGSLAGATLVLGVGRSALGEVVAAPSATFRPSAWIAIGPDGRIALTVHRSEMGQGVRTALPMMLAEELEADWEAIDLVQASPGPEFEDMGTGGSDSVASSWRLLRRAGATARAMLIQAAACTWGVDASSCVAERGEVAHPPSGRRLGYGELASAAAQLPVPKDAPLKDAGSFKIVGQRVRRLDAPRIVTGSAVYGLDLRVEGMFYASIARPPAIAARLVRWDAARARAVQGVRDVVALENALAVVADSTWTAIKGREALDVTWDEPKPGFDSDAFEKTLQEALLRPGVETRREGDARAALAAAATRVEGTYFYAFQTHAAIEPVSCIADVRADRCEIRCGTQHPQRVQRFVAETLKLPREKVTVHVALLGGGFGRRLSPDYAVEAAAVSRAVRAPVQVVWTREDDLHHGHFECACYDQMAAGLDIAGHPVAWLHHKASAFHNLSPLTAEDLKPEAYADSAWGQYDIPYAIPNILTDYSRVDCPVKIGPWRSVFSPPSTFARESFLDEVAHAGGRDPLALRLALLESPRTVKAGSLTIDRERYRRVLRLAADKGGWGQPLPAAEGRRWGRGLAGNVYDGSTHLAYVVLVSVGREGDVRVHRVVCAVDPGRPVNPLGIEGQVESGAIFGLSAALKGEITFKAGRVQQSTYRDYPLMRLSDAPEIDVHIVAGDERPFGMGEPPVPPIAPAVTNAIFAATGKRVRRLPVRAAELAG